MPGQHGNRMLVLLALHTDTYKLRPGRLQLRQGRHVTGAGRRAGPILVLRDIQRVLIRRQRLPQQLRQRILGAQVEIIGRQSRLRRQTGIREIGSADLGAGNVAFHLAPYLAPDIRVPGDRSGDTVDRAAAPATAQAGRTAARRAASHPRRQGCRRKQAGTRFTHQRNRVAIRGLVLLHRLVGDIHHPF